MSMYRTISSDYKVFELDADGGLTREVSPDNPLFGIAMDKMADSFNSAHLEQYLDDSDALRYLGYTVKDKVKSITMERTKKTDENGVPFMRITVLTYPRALKMTQKVCGYIDDYLSAQFSDGWGEGFFYPARFEANGNILAVD